VNLLANNNGRKFNIGRQGEQLLNDEFHKLFMTLKYLNYSRYKVDNNIDNYGDSKERQAEIPDHALRLKKRDDLNYMEIYRKLDNETAETTVYYGYPNVIETYDEKTAVWTTLFDGYFHPASAIKPPTDIGVAPYQLCINPEDGTIMYYDTKNGNNRWVIANANQYLGKKSDTFSGLNFQLIDNLQKVQSSGGSYHYPVPYIPFGKLFSNKKAVPFTTEEGLNNCGIITNKNNLSWVHINAKKLKKIDRRLIKVNLDMPEEDLGFINIYSKDTEFYGFKVSEIDENGVSTMNIFGELLSRDQDFTDVSRGIKLTYNAISTYKYIYAITYIFDDCPSHEGSVIQNYKKVSGANEVYIGDGLVDNIALFIDGLSLEQRGKDEAQEGEYDIYIHNKDEGTIKFLDNDDAEIINQMQMTALVFPDKTKEFFISAVDDVDPDENIVRIPLGTTMSELEQLENYERAMVFCSGLGLRNTVMQKDVEIIDNHLVIKDFVLQQDETGKDIEIYSCFIADVGNSLVCEGVLESNTIYDDNIINGNQYIVFVDGLLMTPTNGDIIVENGSIRLVNSENIIYENLDYVVFEASDNDSRKISVVYDDDVSYFSVRIEDNDIYSVYDNCSCAIVYAAKDEKGDAGILLDEAAVEKPLNPSEGFYKGNQIIRSTDQYGQHTYYLHDFTTDMPMEIVDENEISEVEQLISYYANLGSIQLLGDAERLRDYHIRYHAYSYANMIDEPLMIGHQDTLSTKIIGKDFEDVYNGTTAMRHGWRMGYNSLSTYINGLIVPHREMMVDPETGELTNKIVGATRNFEVDRPVLEMNPTEYYGEKDILATLEIIYTLYGPLKNKLGFQVTKDTMSWFENEEAQKSNTRTIKTEEEILLWTAGDGVIKDYFSSLNLFMDALNLSIYLNEDLKRERISYVVENPERNESMAAHRDFIFLETGDNTIDHKQIYKLANDAIETDFVLVPGVVNVYVNGVLLDDSEFCKFDSNKILFNTNVCGIQQLPKNKEGCLPTTLSDKDIEQYKYLYEYESKKVIRIIEDKPYYVPVSSRDTILIERRDDTNIKRITYEVDFIDKLGYNGVLQLNQQEFNIPETLMQTADHIKIYINGVYYDGGYERNKDTAGQWYIRLTQISDYFMNVDPIDEYLKLTIRDDVQRFAYKEKLGLNKKRLEKITFEWR
jgi:hypothetical protein